MDSSILNPLLGGVLIGCAASVMLYFSGQLAGNSGMVAGLWTLKSDRAWWRMFYLAGLILGTVLFIWCVGRPAYVVDASYPFIIAAGLLVGFGTRLGGGCTSGHGICGMARLSKRSIAATGVFMLSGILTVFVMRHILGGAL